MQLQCSDVARKLRHGAMRYEQIGIPLGVGLPLARHSDTILNGILIDETTTALAKVNTVVKGGTLFA